jgi:protein-disulfide isomerase
MTLHLTRREALALGTAFAVMPLQAFGQEIHDILEMSMGSEDAPVTLIEYASFTCPHCADFQQSVMPQIRENYIEPGKVKLIFREVYFDRAGLWASMIARCAPKDRYFGIVDVLYERQRDWAITSAPEELMDKLYAIGRQAGLTDEEMNACMSDRAFAEALVAEYQKNAAADQIDATPSFILNGTKESNMSYPEFAEKLDAALAG